MLRRLSSAWKNAALLLALILIVVLSAQKRALGTRVDEYRERAEWPYPGFTVPSFKAATLSGDSVRIGSPSTGAHDVLLVFTTTCGYCLQTIPHWKRLTAELERNAPGGVRVYGVSLDAVDETRSYVAEHGLPYPVVALSDSTVIRLYRLYGVPMTLVIGPGGVVADVHRGTYALAGGTPDEGLFERIVAAALR